MAPISASVTSLVMGAASRRLLLFHSSSSSAAAAVSGVTAACCWLYAANDTNNNKNSKDTTNNGNAIHGSSEPHKERCSSLYGAAAQPFQSLWSSNFWRLLQHQRPYVTCCQGMPKVGLDTTIPVSKTVKLSNLQRKVRC
jgi:hypothetical protein